MTTDDEVHAAVREYYGEVLETQADLRTTACCSVDALPLRVRPIVAEVHPEILERFDLFDCAPAPGGDARGELPAGCC